MPAGVLHFLRSACAGIIGHRPSLSDWPLLPQLSEAELAIHRAHRDRKPSPGVAHRGGAKKKFIVVSRESEFRPPVSMPPSGQVLFRDSGNLVPPSLFITQGAMKDIFSHIGWRQMTAQNLVEQSGLMFGHPGVDPGTGSTFAVVRHVVGAHGAAADQVSLTIGHEDWHGMMEEADKLREAGLWGQDVRLVGWYHTHPNNLAVFMSSTDVATQRAIYREEWLFAVVLNPHRELWRAYAGAEAAPVGAVVVDDF